MDEDKGGVPDFNDNRYFMGQVVRIMIRARIRVTLTLTLTLALNATSWGRWLMPRT